jgi:type I restriction enzyme S subunit
MKRVLFETARGAIGQANINTRELRAFRIPVPPIGVQDQFEERCRSLQGITRQQASASAIAVGTFNSLLSRVFFSGEPRLAEQLTPNQVAAAQPA